MFSFFSAVFTTITAGTARLVSLDDAADVDIVRRVVAGDTEALGDLYDRHSRAVYSLALRILRDQSDAEEVVQEVFAQMWRHASRFDRRRGAVIAWLLMMARSRAIDRLRARRGDSALACDAALAFVADPGVMPDAAVISRDEVLRLRAALDDLPLLQRMAIELAFYEGLSHAEVAQRLEQPLGTVKTRIRLGLSKLRDAMVGGLS